MTHSSVSRFCGSMHCKIIINLSQLSNESVFCLRSFSKAKRDCQAQREKINTSCVISHAWLTSLTTCRISHNHQIVLSHSRCGIQSSMRCRLLMMRPSAALSAGQVRFCEHRCRFDERLIASRVSLAMFGVMF